MQHVQTHEQVQPESQHKLQLACMQLQSEHCSCLAADSRMAMAHHLIALKLLYNAGNGALHGANSSGANGALES